MSGKKTDDYRYWLTFLLEDLPVGATFEPGLLHITIIPWFVLEADEAVLTKSFYEKFSGISAYDMRVGKKAELGSDADISVDLVEPRDGMIKLHELALQWFGQIGARWAVKNPYVGEEYIPHIRRRGGKKLTKGQKLDINSLSLVKALRRPDNIRQVAAKVVLDEG